jgi:hypothetical protein
MSKEPVVKIAGINGDDIFVIFDGVKIAKRGARARRKLRPGFRLSPAGACSMDGEPSLRRRGRDRRRRG